MTNDSEPSASERSASGAGTEQMIRLMKAEIERLKANLALARVSDAPNRRTLIKQHVARIDERQDALESLQALRSEASSGD